MAGGAGTKLWPYSRKRRPKQFLDILGCGKSQLRQTYERFLPIIEPERFLVVTTEAYRDMVFEHLPELCAAQVLVEPVGRNTAPSICYAAYALQKQDPHAIMVVTPTDHYVGGDEAFNIAVGECSEFAEQNSVITTLGVRPTHPEIRYGYIQTSDKRHISQVKCFTEKPSLEVATQFIQHRGFYWNTGLFAVPVSVMVKAIEEHMPELHVLFSAKKSIDEIYAECKPISIEQGVMQRADNIYVCCAEFGWSDIGTWGAIHQHTPKDRDGNAKNRGVFTFNTHNSYISTTNGKTAVVSGLDDYIIVDTEDLLMVCPKAEEQSIKRFIDEVKFYKSSR